MSIPKRKLRFWEPKKQQSVTQGGRLKNDKKFYQSYKWRKVRRAYLDRFPLCVHCKDKGVVKLADMVDHIIRMRQGGAEFDDDNLQGLCNHHHNVKSGKERHGK